MKELPAIVARTEVGKKVEVKIWREKKEIVKNVILGRLETSDDFKISKNQETQEQNDQIKLFGKQLSMHIAATNPLALNSDEIKPDIINKEQNLIAEELKNSGKPDEIAKKISLGKITKFKEENSLMTQDWVMEPKKKVKDILSEINIPNLKIKQFARIKIGE